MKLERKLLQSLPKVLLHEHLDGVLRPQTIIDLARDVKYKGLPTGAHAVEIADGKTTNYFLTTFGRRDRETLCAREEVGPPVAHLSAATR